VYGVRRGRDGVERNAREAVAAHVELLRSTGRAVPEPTTRDVSRIAV
jgi:predicted RNase H-like HicB family nuclease